MPDGLTVPIAGAGRECDHHSDDESKKGAGDESTIVHNLPPGFDEVIDAAGGDLGGFFHIGGIVVSVPELSWPII